MPINSLPAGAGTGKIKKKIRDLERLLRKPGLAATKKTEAERALQALKDDLGQASTNNQAKKLAKKYHMVRFFDRKKALRQLKKKGEAGLVDFYYVTMFPKDAKYVSLFAEGAVGREHPFYAEIEKQLEQGKLKGGQEGLEFAFGSQETTGSKRKAQDEPVKKAAKAAKTEAAESESESEPKSDSN